MSTLQLNMQNIESISTRLTCPTYDRSTVTAGIVHVGVGGFHRSHQANYIHQLLSNPQYAEAVL